MPVVVITPRVFFHVAGPHVDLLHAAGFEVRYPPAPDPQGEEATFAALAGADAVIAGGEFYNERLFTHLPRLRVVARAGVGYDRVDVAAATRHRVAVAITPTANHECVAEHAMALLLAVTRQIVGHHADVLRGDWTRRVMLPLRGRTLGLVGLGRIGRSMALRARGFRMNLLAYDEFPNRAFAEEHQIRLVDFPTLLAESDYVTLHAPLTPETRGLMNARTFAQMKPGAILINTARGGLVVEADLVDALRRGQLGGAGLDVFEQEPTPVDNPLLSLPNVVASPHYAGGDVLSNQEMATESARNIVALFRGEWPEGAIVNEQRWDLNAPRA